MNTDAGCSVDLLCLLLFFSFADFRATTSGLSFANFSATVTASGLSFADFCAAAAASELYATGGNLDGETLSMT